MINEEIISNGVDIVEVKRIKKIFEGRNKDKFMLKIFTDLERSYFEKSGYSMESVAGYFAVKEAVMKSLGEGMDRIPFIDIEVRKDGRNNPYIKLTGEAARVAKEKDIGYFEVSIAHEKEYAVAFVIATV